MKKRSLIWLMRSYSHRDPSTPSFEHRWWERLWGGEVSLFDNTMEGSQWKKIQFETWPWWKRKQKHFPHLFGLRKGDRWRVGMKNTVFMFVSVQMPACMLRPTLEFPRSRVWYRWEAAREDGCSCTFCEHWSTASESVPYKKRSESKGTLAFVRVSLKYKALAMKYGESVTLWKPKINPFQTATDASQPKVEILDKDVISNHTHTCQILQLPIFPITQKTPFTCHYSRPHDSSVLRQAFC